MTKTRISDTALQTSTATSGARRLQAYRKRLEQGDLVRADIQVPRAVRTEVVAIAAAEGSRYLETLSALAQFGLEAYRQQASQAHSTFGACLPSNTTSSLALEATRGLSSPLVATARAIPGTTLTETGESPLSRFLKKRKGD